MTIQNKTNDEPYNNGSIAINPANIKINKIVSLNKFIFAKKYFIAKPTSWLIVLIRTYGLVFKKNL